MQGVEGIASNMEVLPNSSDESVTTKFVTYRIKTLPHSETFFAIVEIPTLERNHLTLEQLKFGPPAAGTFSNRQTINADLHERR